MVPKHTLLWKAFIILTMVNILEEIPIFNSIYVCRSENNSFWEYFPHQLITFPLQNKYNACHFRAIFTIRVIFVWCNYLAETDADIEWNTNRLNVHSLRVKINIVVISKIQWMNEWSKMKQISQCQISIQPKLQSPYLSLLQWPAVIFKPQQMRMINFPWFTCT